VKKILITLLIATTAFSDSWAMRCGNNVIDMGDSLYTVLQDCGTPVANYGDTLVYRQSDGMVYTIHFSNNRTVDNITANRG
jgi:hypothetical protein